LGEVGEAAVAHAIADLAGAALHPRRDAIQERGLAGAGFADDGDDLAGPQIERDIGAADEVAVAALEVADGEDGVAHSAASSVSFGTPVPTCPSALRGS